MVFLPMRIPRVVITPLVMLAAVILGLAVPGSAAQAQACGGENQKPCTIFQRVPSCDPGMKEDFGQNKCVRMATPCGAVDQRPCLITERVLSCNPGSYEDLGKHLCVQKTACGAADQRACRVDERIPSCDKGLYEDFGKGKCLTYGDQLRDGFNQCVHVPGVSNANGVQLRTWNCVDLAHLSWERVPLLLDIKTDEEAGMQYFLLKNRLTGKCAAVHAGQKQDGALVIQWDCGIGKHFAWGFDGFGQLMHRESGKCLHSESGSQNAPLTIGKCARIQVTKDKEWTFKRLQESSDRNYVGYLKNGFGSCLQVPEETADGAQLTTWDCDPALTQILWMQTQGITVPGEYFWFRSYTARKCPAVQAGQKQEGARVVQEQCEGEPQGQNFHWTWMAGRQLVNRESGKCLQVASAARNAPATIGACIQNVVSNNTSWVFVKPGGETYR